MGQEILAASENYPELDLYLKRNGIKKIFLVCGSSISLLKIITYFDTLECRMGIKVVRFSRFLPNPLYDSVVEGVSMFREEGCDCIVAVGGGSAMDVAKCIRLYAGMPPGSDYLHQEIFPACVKMVAVPTTAGSGSEATRYAVVYLNGEKQTITNNRCIPDMVLMDATVLETLPDYQKKSTMLDAFCHAIEAFWSVNSNTESRKYSRDAIRMIIENKDNYLANLPVSYPVMLYAANLAGRAINIAQTTAGHAMCYKLSTNCKIAHGHAAALCTLQVWSYMEEHIDQCVDPRGKGFVMKILEELAGTMGCCGIQESIRYFSGLLDELRLKKPILQNIEELEELVDSVNPVRMKNSPVLLDKEVLIGLYQKIFGI